MADQANEQDRMLPIANVGRIMKQILPPSAKISKDAKQTMQECSTEFISFVTSEASHKCHKENRRTINGDDICFALSALGLDNYAQVMMRYLYKYREAEREKTNQVGKGNSTSCPDDHSILDDKHGDHQPVGEEKSSGISTAASSQNLLEFKIIELGDQHHNKSCEINLN